MQRVVGLFAYFAQWIGKCFDMIKALINNTCFLLTFNALETFNILKSELVDVSLGVIDEKNSLL